MRVTQTTDPAGPPISIAEFGVHSRVALDLTPEEQADITRKILAATDYAEAYTDRAFVERDFTLWLPCFPSASEVGLVVPKNPSVITSIRYRETLGAGEWTTLGGGTYYRIPSGSPRGAPSVVVPIPLGNVWPYAQEVEVAFKAGFGADTAVPPAIKAAVCLLAGELYERRENAIVGTITTPAKFAAESLLAPYRLFGGWS